MDTPGAAGEEAGARAAGTGGVKTGTAMATDWNGTGAVAVIMGGAGGTDAGTGNGGGLKTE